MRQLEKIFIVGDGSYYIYEQAMVKAFKEKGYKKCKLIAYGKYLERVDGIIGLFIKAQNKYSIGTQIRKLNKELLELCEKEKPQLVFLYRARHIYAATVKKIKQLGCTVFSYNNDNPFSQYYPRYVWRH